MCGIVGYLGRRNPKDVIMSGLKALEYRGYDSAGVAIYHEGEFKRVRAEGKLVNLQDKLESESFTGRLGIGHTRWATHGPPVEKNAHPHCVEGVSIVHNGIIENYVQLREMLLNEKAEFTSDTDSELVAHLIAKEVRREKTLFEAVKTILPLLGGAYSILAVSQSQPDELIAFKNGPPLILGTAAEEIIVASDIQAIISYTKSIVYLEDNEILYVKDSRYQLFDSQFEELKREPIEIEWNQELVEKQGYPHYMLKEIFEQPRAVAAAIDPHINLKETALNLQLKRGITFEQLKQVERVFIVACGTSFYAGQVGEYYIEQLAGVPVEVDFASEFRYRHPVIPENSLVVVVSQSGETADTLAVLRQVKELGALTLSLCNVKSSTIDRESHDQLYMNAGVEIGVASTKALVCSISVLYLFAMHIAKIKGRLDPGNEKAILQNLVATPSQMEAVLSYDKFFAEAAEMLKSYRGFLYMGRGVNYPIAMEGALKLKELAYMHAEGYAAGEMKHGPLALIDDSMAIVMLAPDDELYEKTLSNLEEAKARGGQIISIGTGENEKLKNLSQYYLSLPKAHWMVNPILEVIPLQLLSYHVADALGHDVDQPRNLAKSVTVE